MAALKLSELVNSLMVERDFHGAEELLLKARSKAEADGDAQTLQYVLTELVGLCHISDPPDWAKAEALSRDRERLFPSAYSKLQTAMIMHHGIQDYAGAIPSLEEAVAQGKLERDDKTVYTALSLLGQARLEMGRDSEALAALSELEAMVARKGSIVVGDETGFLEDLRARNLESERVTRLASTLAAVCRDPDFKKRLRDLAVPA